MATITTRAGKGSPLTNTEVDDNFSNLNSAKYESGSAADFSSVQVYEAGTGTGYGGLTLQTASNGGNAGFVFKTGTTQRFSNTLVGSNTAEYIRWRDLQNNRDLLHLGQTATTFNPAGADIDFQVESNDNANMLFVNANTNKIGFGTNDPQQLAHLVSGGITYLRATGGSNNTGIDFGQHSNGSAYIWHRDDANIIFGTNAHERFRIGGTTSASTVFNEGGDAWDFRVESENQTAMLFVDGDQDNVLVGTASGQNHANSAFVVVGRTELGNGSTTQGSVLLTDQYSSAADDHILNIGTQRSSGGPFISYGLGQDGSSADWVATYDNFSGAHQALILNGAYLQHDIDMANSQTAVGSAVSLTRTFESGRAGFIWNDQAHHLLDFRVESDGNANMLFVNADTNSVNIGTNENSGYTFNVSGNAQVRQNLTVTSTGGENYTQGDLRLVSSTVDTPEARGQGVFMFNEGADRTWYMGTQYNDGGRFGIGFVDGTSLNTGAAHPTAHHITIYQDADGIVLNEQGADRNFRVEGDTNTHMIFVDAGIDAMAIGTSSVFDNASLHVQAHTKGELRINQWNGLSGDPGGAALLGQNLYRHYDASASPSITTRFQNTHSSISGAGVLTGYPWNGGSLVAGTATSSVKDDVASINYPARWHKDYFHVNHDGASGIDFRVSSDTTSHMLYVDSGSNRLTVGGSTQAGVATFQGMTTGTVPTVWVYGVSDSIGDRMMTLRDTSANTNGTVGKAGLHFTSSPGTDYTIGKWYDGSASHFVFTDQSGNEIMRFHSGGASVGIGQSSPDGMLTVSGNNSATQMVMRVSHTQNDNYVKGMRINAPNSVGTQTYADLAVDPEEGSFGISVGHSSGALSITDTDLNRSEFRIRGSRNVQGNTVDNEIVLKSDSVQITRAHGRVTAYVQDMFHIGADRYRNSMLHGNGNTHSYIDGGSSNYAGYEYDNETWIPNVFIPYSPNQVYRLSASIYQRSLGNGHSQARHYMGVIGYDENFNFVNVDAIGTYQYNMASSAYITAGQFLERDVTIKGWQGSGTSDGNKMDQGTVYIRPMMLLNYQTGGCKAVVTGFSITPAGTVADNDSNAGTNY